MSDNSDNTVEFGILMNERIKAQIEIYERFGESFSKTIDLLRENKDNLSEMEKSVIDRLDDIEQSVMDQVREIVKGLNQLSNDIKSQNDIDRERWSSLQRERQQTLDTLQDQIKDLTAEKSLLPTLHALVTELRKDTDILSGSMSNNHQKIYPLVDEILDSQQSFGKVLDQLVFDEKSRAKLLESISGQIEVLYNARVRNINRASAIKWAIGIAGTILTIIITLITAFGMHIAFSGH